MWGSDLLSDCFVSGRSLGMGGMPRAAKILGRFPYLFDIRRVTIRNVRFYMEDLFRGTTGQAERKLKSKQYTEARAAEEEAPRCDKIADSLNIDKIEWLTEFRPNPKHGDPGITVYKVHYIREH